MHTYGHWPAKYFNQIEAAASEIGWFLSRWGRVPVLQTKEKFGTVRVYCSFGWDSLHCIIWPRHCWIHSWWPYKLDLKISWYLMPILNKLVVKYHIWLYRKSYARAVEKYPHLKDEILSGADFGEVLEGVAGYKQSDYWFNGVK
jgi:hypothetical protein